MRRGIVALAVALVVMAATAGQASAFQKGFYDEAVVLGYADDFGFRTLNDLGADIVRMNLYWNRVAKSRPNDPTNPNDPAYDWSEYDQSLAWAEQYGIEVLLSVIGTPGWANGGKAQQYAPNDFGDLEAFSEAAAKHFPQVTKWASGNEPNAPNFLKPQSVRQGGKWVFVSPEIYADMCKAVVDGINAADPRDTVACGLLNPRGKLVPNGRRDSVAPILFLERMVRAGAPCEAIGVHPYSSTPKWSPTKKIRSNSQIVLGTIGTFIRAVDRVCGGKPPIWVTEYGYQTNPPDKLFGVSWRTQANWMSQAFKIMKANKRIKLGLTFQIVDDSNPGGWQSGVLTNSIKKKPWYAAFKRL